MQLLRLSPITPETDNLTLDTVYAGYRASWAWRIVGRQARKPANFSERRRDTARATAIYRLIFNDLWVWIGEPRVSESVWRCCQTNDNLSPV